MERLRSASRHVDDLTQKTTEIKESRTTCFYFKRYLTHGVGFDPPSLQICENISGSSDLSINVHEVILRNILTRQRESHKIPLVYS